MKGKIFLVLIILLIGIAGGVLFEKYSDVLKEKFSGSLMTTDNDSSDTKKDPMADWGMISNGLGFSLKYPYKDVGAAFDFDRYSRISFNYFPEAFSKDKQVAEKLRADISEVGPSYEFDISAGIDPAAMFSPDFSAWIKTFLESDPILMKNNEKALSEETSPTVFAGEAAYLVVRQIEMPKEKSGLHYTRKDIFARNNDLIYRISRVAASDDTIFLRSGATGKDFLNYIDQRSTEILQTFVFDKSITDSKIVLPKITLPKLAKKQAENREKLLAALRQGPFFDEKQAYPAILARQKCPYKDIDFFLNDFVAGDKGVAELNIFDKEGGYHGALPMIDKNFPMPISDSIYGVRWLPGEYLTDSRRLFFPKDTNQKIGVMGKKFSMTKLSIDNVGEACQSFEAIMPTTPYSVATMTVNQGSISPISYDVDGDGIEDLQLSPIHPLFPEKKAQFDAVLTDMKAVGEKTE